MRAAFVFTVVWLALLLSPSRLARAQSPCASNPIVRAVSIAVDRAESPEHLLRRVGARPHLDTARPDGRDLLNHAEYEPDAACGPAPPRDLQQARRVIWWVWDSRAGARGNPRVVMVVYRARRPPTMYFVRVLPP